MLVRPQRKHGPKAEMNVVPYIDVMLVLLVIFMVTAPMLVQGVKIELPKVAAEALPVENERQILTLSVKADGGFYWNLGSELDVENQTDSAVDLAELQAKVGAVIAAQGDAGLYPCRRGGGLWSCGRRYRRAAARRGGQPGPDHRGAGRCGAGAMMVLGLSAPPAPVLTQRRWTGAAGAALTTLGLHAGLFALLLTSWTPTMDAPVATQVMQTQLISLPPPVPVLPEPPVAKPVEAPPPPFRLKLHHRWSRPTWPSSAPNGSAKPSSSASSSWNVAARSNAAATNSSVGSKSIWPNRHGWTRSAARPRQRPVPKRPSVPGRRLPRRQPAASTCRSPRSRRSIRSGRWTPGCRAPAR